MKKIHILLAEDEASLALIIRETLEGEGFCVRVAEDGEQALRMFMENRPDVLVADVMMPRMDGFELVGRVRKADRCTPVLMLTARTETADVVRGFEMGANDYLRKPFGMQELIVRIKALAGRAYVPHAVPEPERDYALGSYTFSPAAQQLETAGLCLPLSHREAEILKRLCARRSEVVPMRDILLELWGDDSFFNARSLHVFITKLRRKLGRDPRVRIVNVRGVGYKLLVAEPALGAE